MPLFDVYTLNQKPQAKYYFKKPARCIKSHFNRLWEIGLGKRILKKASNSIDKYVNIPQTASIPGTYFDLKNR